MIEQSILSLELPYRDPMEMRSFSFGIDAAGNALGEGASIHSLRPMLCVVSGLRGDEIQQTLVCAMLVDCLRRMESSKALEPGALVEVIPCANPASMGIGRRFWPSDKTDVNRSFPGSEKGDTTQRIAAALFERVRGFRYGVHLSSFYLEGDFLPHIRVMHGPGNRGNHGADFGLPYVTHYAPGPFDTTTLHYNWRRAGTEAYTFYTQETTVADEAAAKDAVRSLLWFMSARGIAQQTLAGGFRSVELAERSLVPVSVPTGGVCCPQVQIGSVVEEGQQLAYVRDLLRGSVTARLCAPCDGVVFYRSRTPLVNEQTLAFQIAPPSARDDADVAGESLA